MGAHGALESHMTMRQGQGWSLLTDRNEGPAPIIPFIGYQRTGRGHSRALELSLKRWAYHRRESPLLFPRDCPSLREFRLSFLKSLNRNSTVSIPERRLFF